MRKMKNSGIEWIGQIPEDWNIKRLKAVLCERNESNNPIKTDYILSLTNDRGVIPYDEKGDVGNKSKEDVSGYKLAYPNDIVLNSMNVIIGSVALSKYYGCVSPVYYMLYPRNPMDDVRYYNYIFQTKEFQSKLKGYGNGIMEIRMRIQMSKLNTVELPIPDATTQTRIADFLDEKCGKIDRYIEKQQQVIEKLKVYKQSVITEAVTKGLNPDVPMKDSGIEWIGMIPVHWETPEIKYLVRIASGGTPDRNHPEYWNGNIPWIKTGELQNDIIISAEEYITDEGLNNSSAQIFDVDTILVAMYGQGKTRGMTGLLKIPASTNQACAGLTVSSPSIHIQYLWQCLIGAYDAIRAEAAGSGQPNLSATLIGNFHVALPPIEEQDKIVDHIKNRTAEISSAIEKADSLLNKLIEYKKSLIYETVTNPQETKRTEQSELSNNDKTRIS